MSEFDERQDNASRAGAGTLANNAIVTVRRKYGVQMIRKSQIVAVHVQEPN